MLAPRQEDMALLAEAVAERQVHLAVLRLRLGLGRDVALGRVGVGELGTRGGCESGQRKECGQQQEAAHRHAQDSHGSRRGGGHARAVARRGCSRRGAMAQPANIRGPRTRETPAASTSAPYAIELLSECRAITV